jgi:hypothetical protein
MDIEKLLRDSITLEILRNYVKQTEYVNMKDLRILLGVEVEQKEDKNGTEN